MKERRLATRGKELKDVTIKEGIKNHSESQAKKITDPLHVSLWSDKTHT